MLAETNRRNIILAAIFWSAIFVQSSHQRVTNNNDVTATTTSRDDDDNGTTTATNTFIDEIYENSGAAKSETAAYIQASIPSRMFQCVRKMKILRCMKLFIWQKMENRTNFRNSGNLTRDFMDEFFQEDDRLPSLTDRKYAKLSDDELTKKLVVHFQRYFKDRDIKLHFIPGVMVQIVPNKQNKIKFSLKRRTVPVRDRVTGRKDSKKEKKKHKNSYKHTMIQMAVPVMMMPAIILGTFLPFVLPALKMATIMSMVLNNGALMAALMYAARTHALGNEQEVVHYSHSGYH